MKLALTKAGDGLFIPATAQDAELLKGIKAGEVIHANFSKMRNGKFHRKFFSMINYVFDNQEKYSNIDDLLVEIKVCIGHYTEYIRESGEMVFLPKSISFAKMDDIEFQDFYRKAIQAIILGGIMQGTEDEIMRAVEHVAINY